MALSQFTIFPKKSRKVASIHTKMLSTMLAGSAYSLFHALWPFLWIWATLWRKERGWGFQKLQQEQHDIHHRVDILIDQEKTRPD